MQLVKKTDLDSDNNMSKQPFAELFRPYRTTYYMNWLKNIGVLTGVMMVAIVNVVGQSVSEQKTNLLEFTWANDFIFGMDRYFTNGLELKYYAPFIAKSPTKYLLLPHKKDELVWHGITLTQHFFTPRIKSTDNWENSEDNAEAERIRITLFCILASLARER